MRRSPRKNAVVRGRQRHADPLQGPVQTQALGLRDRQAINDAQSEVALARRLAIIMHRCCETGRSSHRPSPPQSTRQEAESSSQEERRPGREQTTARILLHGANWPTAIST
jgi:hypothetical protein